ncbi:MAG: hypothetical protein ACYDBQ_11930 [Thermoplasmatota archaeon]
MRGRLLVVLFLIPWPLPVAADLQVSSQPLHYGDVATLTTNAQSGNLTILAPESGPACYSVARVQGAGNGTVADLPLDRAGTWRLVHDSGGQESATAFRVLPRPLAVEAGTRNGTLHVRVANDTGPAGGAALDFYLDGAPILHRWTNVTGDLALPLSDLPFAGLYDVAAYRDLGEPPFPYQAPFTYADPAPCDGSYDAPDEYGNLAHAVARPAMRVPVSLAGGVQHAGAGGAAAITWPGNLSLPPPTVHLQAAGRLVAAADVALVANESLGRLVLSGIWEAPGNLSVLLEWDGNGDGVADATARAEIVVEPEGALGIVPVADSVPPSVPAPRPDGRPGTISLRFRIEAANREGDPPEIPEGDVRVVGDVLPATPFFDAATKSWGADVTPTGVTFQIQVDWPGIGNATLPFTVPGGQGAKVATSSQLVVDEEGFVNVSVARFNDMLGACHCGYEPVTDGDVALRWADTGDSAVDSQGRPLEVVPGSDGGCTCWQVGGTYHFANVILHRSGLLVATATINVPGRGGRFLYGYAPVPVVPQPLYDLYATPSASVAGAFTTYHVQAAPGAPDGILHVTRDGRDVAVNATEGLSFAALFPAGRYNVTVEDALAPFSLPPEWGLHGTRHAATIDVEPARLVFTPSGQNATSASDPSLMGGHLAPPVAMVATALGPDGSPLPGRLLFTSSAATLGSGGVPCPPSCLDAAGNSWVASNPAHIVIDAAGLGNVTAQFRADGSGANEWEPTNGTLQIVAPRVVVEAARAPLVGHASRVTLRLSDPTGTGNLSGQQIALAVWPQGGGWTTVAKGALEGNRSEAVANLSWIPEASGLLAVIVGSPPFDTGERVAVAAAPEALTVGLPETVPAGALVTVRVAAFSDPFPAGTIEAFHRNATFVGGTATLVAPADPGSYPVRIVVLGFVAWRGVILVEPVRNLVAPSRVAGGETFVVQAGAGAHILFAGRVWPTDPSGAVHVVAPPAVRDVVLPLVASAGTWQAEQPVTVESSLPRLLLALPSTLAPGVAYRPVVTAAGSHASPPGLVVTVGAEHVSGLYRAPRLAHDVDVYAIATAPGYQAARLVVTLQGAR